MVLPSLKLDKLLQKFSSSEDEELDKIIDEEAEYFENMKYDFIKQSGDINDNLNTIKSRKTNQKNSNGPGKECNGEVKVVELKVEPIVLDDSNGEDESSEILKCKGKIFSKSRKKLKNVKIEQKIKKKSEIDQKKFDEENEIENKKFKELSNPKVKEENDFNKTPHSKRPFTCTICNKTLARTDNMKTHMEIHNNQCIICDKNFEFRKDFNLHMKEIHNRVNKIKDTCMICDKEFKNRKEYNAHIKNVHSVIIDIVHTENTRKIRPRIQRQLNCKKCNKRMKNEQLFMLHMQIHDNHKETECVICNKSFENVNLVLEHYGNFDKKKGDEHYIKIRPFSCHLCTRRYKNRRDLSDHLEVHADQRRFLCPLCGKRFSKKFNMKTHLKVHEKTYPSCCNKNFRNYVEYTTHQRHVHGENNLICPICNKGFTRKDNMKAHMETHLKWKCNLCNNINFDFRRDFNKHMREIHNCIKKYICTICSKEFLLRYNYTKHLESHNRIKDKCIDCDKEFRNCRDFNAHMRNEHGEIIVLPKKKLKTESEQSKNIEY